MWFAGLSVLRATQVSATTKEAYKKLHARKPEAPTQSDQKRLWFSGLNPRSWLNVDVEASHLTTLPTQLREP